MDCTLCGKKAVLSSPTLCREHFLDWFEKRTEETIRTYSLFTKEDRVLVAASGGKDSSALLVTLAHLGYQVEALAIDEGIAGYRDQTLADLWTLCTSRNIPLHVVSFHKEIGAPLDSMVKDHHACSVCGVLRRYLLNKHAKGFDVIATGHNLDDEAQAVLMNLVKSHTGLLSRTRARTPGGKGFVPRVKPFLLLKEKEVMAYTMLQELPVSFHECPYAPDSFRASLRDTLNAYEHSSPGMKLSLVEASMRIAAPEQHELPPCSVCGEPSSHAVCRACSLRASLAAPAGGGS
jgi:uncharacterized protein (TIGR00269 family)